MKVFLFTFLTCITSLFGMELNNFNPKPLSIIYTPWREMYNNQVTLQRKDQNQSTFSEKPCVFCKIALTDNDQKEYILYRGTHVFLTLAMQPYVENGIHFLLIPYAHTKKFGDLSSLIQQQMNELTQKICIFFHATSHTTTVNTNEGTYAGASIPNHHHRHIIINNESPIYNLIEAIKIIKPTINLSSIFEQLKPCISTLMSTKYLHSSSYSFDSWFAGENCYYCSLAHRDNSFDSEHLVIHRGNNAMIMFSHFPSHYAEINIFPYEHIECLSYLGKTAFDEMNICTLKVLKILNAEDVNTGFISYGEKSCIKNREHMKQRIIPRDHNPAASSIVEGTFITANIRNFYEKFLLEWNKTT